MRVVKERLTVLLPSLSVFLDVDDMKEGAGAQDLHQVHTVLVFAMSTYFHSAACMREVLWSVCLERPIVLLLEPDSSREGVNLEQCRALLREAYHQRFDEWDLLRELQACIDDAGDASVPSSSRVPTLEELESALLGGAEQQQLEW